MKREASIQALLKKAKADFAALKPAYEASLHEKHVRDDLKVLVKNIFENLRSCLDYLAQDLFETHCANAKQPDRLYFPVRSTAPEFQSAITKYFPGLDNVCASAVSILDAAQPYNDPWLGQFNRLNNHNKHQDLVEQTRTEARNVTVSGGGGSVSWGPGVTFGSGVGVMGVPIDPKTQLPVPNSVVQTQITVWVDFQFKEIGQSVLPFIETSIKKVEELFTTLQPHL